MPAHRGQPLIQLVPKLRSCSEGLSWKNILDSDLKIPKKKQNGFKIHLDWKIPKKKQNGL